jgi:hypothetical protein
LNRVYGVFVRHGRVKSPNDQAQRPGSPDAGQT